VNDKNENKNDKIKEIEDIKEEDEKSVKDSPFKRQITSQFKQEPGPELESDPLGKFSFRIKNNNLETEFEPKISSKKPKSSKIIVETEELKSYNEETFENKNQSKISENHLKVNTQPNEIILNKVGIL
jgi:hypothetical protein